MNLKSKPWLAHSAADENGEPDFYQRHVSQTIAAAKSNCEQMLLHAENPPQGFLENVVSAARFHDLGKLDDDIQEVLNRDRKGRLRWDHIDAGVAHLQTTAPMAAWLIRGHHAPGLPSKPKHFSDDQGRKLRGRRRDELTHDSHELHQLQIQRTNKYLEAYIHRHDAEVDHGSVPTKCKQAHGLSMRLALSCLVDADHADTCFFDSGQRPAVPLKPRWEERLTSLVKYVSSFPNGNTPDEEARNINRKEFFDSCILGFETGNIFSCEGPVGIGKSTSVTAFLLKLAQRDNLRRVIIVAPFTNILNQFAKTFREAIVLPDEDPEQVIVEQHHRADFNSREARSLASLWNAPIVLTTAVSFFETMSSRNPGALRKLHYLPGSALFLDEAHAAIPVSLWPQNWKWLNELTEKWRCRAVLASGTLTRFWENEDIIAKPIKLQELLPEKLASKVSVLESERVRYLSLNDSSVMDIATLCEKISAAVGPRLVILNTVQNAAVVAKFLREELGGNVLHMSTALTPRDRAKIYQKIVTKLKGSTNKNWSLVATSCVEAGVDFSFRTGFRERFSVASVLQVGGRVNRNSEFNHEGPGIVYSFELEGENTTKHPAARGGERILRSMLEDGSLNRLPPSQSATIAMTRELNERGGLGNDLLMNAEIVRDYPAVEELGRVITADTKLVVVEPKLIKAIEKRKKVNSRDVLNGSVQLWATKIDKLKMEPIHDNAEIYAWRDAYAPEFLGIMEGILKSKSYENGGGVI